MAALASRNSYYDTLSDTMDSSHSPQSRDRYLHNNSDSANANRYLQNTHSNTNNNYGRNIRSYVTDENGEEFEQSDDTFNPLPPKQPDGYRRSVHTSSPNFGNNNPNNNPNINGHTQPRHSVRQSLPPPENSTYDHLRRKSYTPFDRPAPTHTNHNNNNNANYSNTNYNPNNSNHAQYQSPSIQQPALSLQSSHPTPPQHQQHPPQINYLSHRASTAITTAPARHQSLSRLSPRLVSSGTASSSTVTSASTAAMSANTQLTEPPAHSMKVVVVGDGGCGKTCLLISYSQRHFPETYVPTVFENYITQTNHPKTQKLVELALWDTAGQEEYDRLRPLSYPETDLVIICFAVDCPNSLENVHDKWHPEIVHFLPNQPIILVGLKTDRRFDDDCLGMLKSQGLEPVSETQGKEMAAHMGAIYMECSSKRMEGVDDVFKAAIRTAVRDAGDKQESIPTVAPAVKSRKRFRSCRPL